MDGLRRIAGAQWKKGIPKGKKPLVSSPWVFNMKSSNSKMTPIIQGAPHPYPQGTPRHPRKQPFSSSRPVFFLLFTGGDQFGTCDAFPVAELPGPKLQLSTRTYDICQPRG
jgi:hypothetical protein